MLKFLNSHSPSSFPPTIFLIVFAIALCCFFTAVRSEPDSVDLCAGTPSVTHGSCTINCFRADPVCGVNGVTYWCGCPEARCAGIRVAKLGFCEVGSGGSAPLSGQALLLVHIVWLIVLGFSVLFGLF